MNIIQEYMQAIAPESQTVEVGLTPDNQSIEIRVTEPILAEARIIGIMREKPVFELTRTWRIPNHDLNGILNFPHRPDPIYLAVLAMNGHRLPENEKPSLTPSGRNRLNNIMITIQAEFIKEKTSE